MKSELANYIRKFEFSADRSGQHRNKLGKSEMRMILRFSAYQVDKQPMQCQHQIAQAWWTLLNKRTGVALDGQIWTHRKQLLIQLAYQYSGFLRSSDIAGSFNIPMRTARNWITHFMNEGLKDC